MQHLEKLYKLRFDKFCIAQFGKTMAYCRGRHKKIFVPCFGCLLILPFLMIIMCPDCKQNVQHRLFAAHPAEPQQSKPCRCAKCVSEKGLSVWFDKNFNPNIKPLLTVKNRVIYPNVQKWWLHLQGVHNGTDLDSIITKLFEVVPNTDPYEGDTTSRCRRCAIVGNSGNLKGSNQGTRIDSHDFVMRMNRARTSGFEKDVGSKTTHYFMYPESAQNLPKGVHFVLVPFKSLDLQWIVSALTTGQIRSTYVRVMQKIHLDKDKVMILNPTFLKYVHDNWTLHHGKYPSTGMIVIFFALHICDEVSVFGYGADSKGYWHHYWEKNKHAGAFLKTGVHDAKFETEIIRKLKGGGKITFYNGTNTE